MFKHPRIRDVNFPRSELAAQMLAADQMDSAALFLKLMATLPSLRLFLPEYAKFPPLFNLGHIQVSTDDNFRRSPRKARSPLAGSFATF